MRNMFVPFDFKGRDTVVKERKAEMWRAAGESGRAADGNVPCVR